MIQNIICHGSDRLGFRLGVVLRGEKREQRMVVVVSTEGLNNRI
jgi:hypothetical protein